MFTNLPFRSQIYGCWNLTDTGALDDGPYQRIDHQLDEVKYSLEQYAMKSHIWQSQQGYAPYFDMYQPDWYGDIDQRYEGVMSQPPPYFQQQFRPLPPFFQQHLQPFQQLDAHNHPFSQS